MQNIVSQLTFQSSKKATFQEVGFTSYLKIMILLRNVIRILVKKKLANNLK